MEHSASSTAGKLTAPVTSQSLEKSFNFALKFHLDPKKGQSNRTTGQTRGLGGVVDSFLRGKVIESAVVDILKKINVKKDYQLDFEVHDADDSDPDIVKITENGKTRSPNVFIEIKNTSEGDRWIGLHEEQFETIKKNKIVGDHLEKIFIIYASIKNKNSSNQKQDDLLGVYLKNKIGTKEYSDFSDMKDLYVEVMLALSAKDLYDKGTRFEKGYYFYETEIFREINIRFKDRKGVKKIKAEGKFLPRFKYDNKFPYPEKFGDLKFNGGLELFEKNNEKSTRMYVYCLSNVEVSNDVIGIFNLKKDHLYEYMPKTLNRNPVLNRNNIWIAKRNVHNIIKKTPEELLREIANII